jgi:hypothetical protein
MINHAVKHYRCNKAAASRQQHEPKICAGQCRQWMLSSITQHEPVSHRRYRLIQKLIIFERPILFSRASARSPVGAAGLNPRNSRTLFSRLCLQPWPAIFEGQFCARAAPDGARFDHRLLATSRPKKIFVGSKKMRRVNPLAALELAHIARITRIRVNSQQQFRDRVWPLRYH